MPPTFRKQTSSLHLYSVPRLGTHEGLKCLEVRISVNGRVIRILCFVSGHGETWASAKILHSCILQGISTLGKHLHPGQCGISIKSGAMKMAPETGNDLELRVSWYLEMLERRRNRYCRLSKLCSSNKRRRIHEAALIVESELYTAWVNQQKSPCMVSSMKTCYLNLK